MKRKKRTPLTSGPLTESWVQATPSCYLWEVSFVVIGGGGLEVTNGTIFCSGPGHGSPVSTRLPGGAGPAPSSWWPGLGLA